MPKKSTALTEQQLVDYIQDFFTNHYKAPDKSDSKTVQAQINDFINQRPINDVNDKTRLHDAIMMQHNAFLFHKASRHHSTYFGSSGGSTVDIILFPNWGYGYGYGYGYGCGWGGHHHCGGGSGDGDAALIMLAILAVGSALAAAYGMATDLAEMSQEIYNKQRVGANLATLALTGAAVVGMTMAAAALFASNPIGWAVVATSALVIGVALLVKGARALINAIDASLEQKSGLSSDSRFQLTETEEEHLKSNMHATPEDIEKIKGIIRGLAIQAKSTSQTGFFGSNERYLEIVKTLTEVKKGHISEGMQAQYGLSLPREQPEADGSESLAM